MAFDLLNIGIGLVAGVILGAVWGWNLSRWSKPPPKDARLWHTRVIIALEHEPV